MYIFIIVRLSERLIDNVNFLLSSLIIIYNILILITEIFCFLFILNTYLYIINSKRNYTINRENINKELQYAR